MNNNIQLSSITGRLVKEISSEFYIRANYDVYSGQPFEGYWVIFYIDDSISLGIGFSRGATGDRKPPMEVMPRSRL